MVVKLVLGREWITGPRRRGPVIQRRVRPHRVVLNSPPLDYDPGLLQRVEDLSVQAFISQLSIKTFAVSVLPGAAWLDVQGSRPQIPQSLAQFLGDELRSVVRTNRLRNPSPHHHLRQCLNHLSAPHSPLYRQRQTFPRLFVEQRQQPQRSSVMSPRADKVVTPHVVGPLRPEPHAGTVVSPQPCSWPLFLRHFQPFPPPDPLYPVLAYLPAAIPQQRCGKVRGRC